LFRACLAILLLLSAVTAGAQISLTRGTNFSLDVAADGRIVFDLLGDIWVIPNGGGVARAISAGPAGARRPRWSPAADAIVFQARDAGQEQLWPGIPTVTASSIQAIVSRRELICGNSTWQRA